MLKVLRNELSRVHKFVTEQQEQQEHKTYFYGCGWLWINAEWWGTIEKSFLIIIWP